MLTLDRLWCFFGRHRPVTKFVGSRKTHKDRKVTIRKTTLCTVCGKVLHEEPEIGSIRSRKK